MLVYPSIYEGFGMPILEAMACGTPVVTSARGAMAEVAGDAALLVEPESVESIADGISRVLRDESLRRELVRRGNARVGEFSWERAARQTRAVFEEAMVKASGTQGSACSVLNEHR
jgi:glycosyltransferase involved in cell wall biosynthesis